MSKPAPRMSIDDPRFGKNMSDALGGMLRIWAVQKFKPRYFPDEPESECIEAVIECFETGYLTIALAPPPPGKQSAWTLIPCRPENAPQLQDGFTLAMH
jgi:hypothetical protein